jgi:MYXO-CTERM domain-containing protein
VVSEFVNQAATATTVVNDGAWHQIVGVYDPPAKAIYVDGSPAEATDASEPMVSNAAPFLIGGINFSGIASSRYTGLLDEVQVYDHALGAAEIEFLFESPAQVVPEPAVAGSLAALAALAGLGAHRRRSSASG